MPAHRFRHPGAGRPLRLRRRYFRLDVLYVVREDVRDDVAVALQLIAIAAGAAASHFYGDAQVTGLAVAAAPAERGGAT